MPHWVILMYIAKWRRLHFRGDGPASTREPSAISHPYVGISIQHLFEFVVSTHEDGNGVNTEVGDDVDGSVFGSIADGFFFIHFNPEIQVISCQIWWSCPQCAKGRDLTRRRTLPIKLHRVLHQVLKPHCSGREEVGHRTVLRLSLPSTFKCTRRRCNCIQMDTSPAQNQINHQSL